MNLNSVCRSNATPGFQPFDSLHNQLERLFNPTFGYRTESGQPDRPYTPSLDVTENKDSMVVSIELPGVAKENVQVTFDDGVLSISGERKQKTHSEDATCHLREQVQGRFERHVHLPKPIDVAAVKAAYKDGVLTITLPKAAEARPRQINVVGN
ncbi:MAG: Hsp20/alpha crystallin family protein [Pedosphaera sp.]|nr:Hsp20/alpha crystallin family protein [Pedosphaera sp.]